MWWLLNKQLILTKLSVSGSSQKKGFPSFSCFLTKFSISTSKLAEVVPSEPCVDCSHFSNNSANKGNSGCLEKGSLKTWICIFTYVKIKTSSLEKLTVTDVSVTSSGRDCIQHHWLEQNKIKVYLHFDLPHSRGKYSSRICIYLIKKNNHRQKSSGCLIHCNWVALR